MLRGANGSAEWVVDAPFAAAAAHDDPSKTYNYLAIGDWGNDSPGQYAAAAGMTVAHEGACNAS